MIKKRQLIGSLLVIILLTTMLAGGNAQGSLVESNVNPGSGIAQAIASQGIVTLTFDDGYENVYQNGLPVLNQFGFKATVFMITGISAVQDANLLNLQELQALRFYGWEIDSHTVHHVDLATIPLSQAASEISDSKSWIISNHLGTPMAFAYPFGGANADVYSLVSNNYTYARTVIEGINDFSDSNVALNAVPLWGSSSYNSLTNTQQWINSAISQKKWAVIMLHGVTSDENDPRLNSTYGWVSTSVLTTFLTFLKNSNVLVKNFSKINNSVPVAVNDALTTLKNTALNVAVPGILSNDTDADDNSLTVVKVSNPSHGSLTLNSNGSFVYTPTTGYTGTDSFTYQAYDGSAYSNTATVSVTVKVNTPPVAVNDAYTAFKNTALNVAAPGVLGNDTDADGTSLTAAKVSNPSHGSVTINSNGSFVYTPRTGYTGADSFTYRAYDGSAYSNTVTVSLTIKAANTPPVAVNDSYITNANTALNIASPGLLSNDTDADGNSITAVKVSDPSHGSIALNSNGSFTYMPATGYTGTDSFTYQAYDGSANSNTAAVSITVKAVHTPPIAEDDPYTTSADTPLNVAAPGVLSNDIDPDGNPLMAVHFSDPSHGFVTLNSNGSFAYTPNPGFTGSDWFTYKANDGLTDSNVATVSVTINVVNTAPVAVNDSYTTNANTALTVAVPGLFSNDTDADGNSLTAVKVSDPSHGSITLNSNGSFVYTPTTGYTGSDSFNYKANDGLADSNTATVSITIKAVNTPPVVANDSYTTNANTALNVAAPGVLSNDTDADGNSLTAVKVSDPSHGSVIVNSNGSLVYTPNAGYTGSDSFTYKANDGLADSNTATVSISITQSSQGTFGLNSGDGTDTYSSDLTLTGMRFQNTAGTGTLTKLEILFDEANPHGQVRLGVYADDNGKPGSLLLDAGQVTIANGWVSISGLNLAVTANTCYWLVFELERQNGVKIQSGTPQDSLAFRYLGSYGAFPSSFPNPDGYYNAEYVMRATVKSGG